MQLTVTGVNNGSAEILTIDGSDIALTQANSLTTASNALQASVALTDSTATVSLSHATGISSALTEAILDAITYRNSSQDPNPLSRVVTLNSLQDDGGTANDGSANLPDGVRLVLQLPPGAALPGRLQRDWARPLITRRRS